MPPTREERHDAVCVADARGVTFEGALDAEHRAGLSAQVEACRVVLHHFLDPLAARIASVRVALHCRREWHRRDGAEVIEHDHGLVVQIVVRGPYSRVPVVWQRLDRGDLVGELAAALTGELDAELAAAGSDWLLAAPHTGPAILAPLPAALFLHECIGHLSEADSYVTDARSAGFGLGDRWCRFPLRVVDDPTLPGRRGGYLVDDEGEPAAPTVVVEAGVWRGLLYDRARARELGSRRSGNGRRVPGAAAALPRMSVLRADGGDDTVAALVASIKRGFLCFGTFGGRAAGMSFVLRPAYAVWIEDGRLTERVMRRFDVVGDRRSAVAAIAGMSADVEMFDPIFGCDKDGQNGLAVSMGAPHILLEQVELRPIECAR